MRVIAGKFRNRRLHSLRGGSTRPMLGRMRQRMFDILQGSIEGRVFADLYAGTGAVGIEAISRGASRVLFVESDLRAAGVIRRNLAVLDAKRLASVRVAKVQSVVNRIVADIYFVGPPYHLSEEYSGTLRALSRNPSDWVIAQHHKKSHLNECYGSLSRVRVVRVGSNVLSMYRRDTRHS